MRTPAASLALWLAVTALACTPSSKPPKPLSIEPAALVEVLRGAEAPRVIDVRSPAEYSAGHIPGAINVPFEEIAERIVEIDAPNGVALYCMVGPRARKGETALREVGYTNVIHIEGGLSAWKAQGFAVETGP